MASCYSISLLQLFALWYSPSTDEFQDGSPALGLPLAFSDCGSRYSVRFRPKRLLSQHPQINRGSSPAVSRGRPGLFHFMDQAFTKQKIKELRAMVSEGDRVAIVLQNDPDPDAMASAMALLTLLGHNKQTTPFFAFKPVTRPENRTMEHLLEIEIQPAATEDLRAFDKIAMVDVQPPYFGEKIPRADIAIDHHPGYPGGAAPFEDVRVKYGATSTIMTEYLLTADEKISERLATALLYGIRSDTLALSRRVTDDDLQAFTYLVPLANYSVLRQIDRPELPLSFAHILARAMKRMVVKDHLVVLNLGRVKRDDLIVQM